MTEPVSVETLYYKGRERRHYLRYVEDGVLVVQEFQPSGALLVTYPETEHENHKKHLLDIYSGGDR